jgi:hypothetical protein
VLRTKLVNWERGVESENPEEEDARQVPGGRPRRKRIVKAPNESLTTKKRTPLEVVVLTSASSHLLQSEPNMAYEERDPVLSGTPDSPEVGGEPEFLRSSCVI